MRDQAQNRQRQRKDEDDGCVVAGLIMTMPSPNSLYSTHGALARRLRYLGTVPDGDGVRTRPEARHVLWKQRRRKGGKRKKATINVPYNPVHLLGTQYYCRSRSECWVRTADVLRSSHS